MSDYISRQGMLAILNQSQTMTQAFKGLYALPSADVRENVKGEWIKTEEDDYLNEDFYDTNGDHFITIKCSNCKRIYAAEDGDGTDFCPFCGTDMRGEQ